MAKRKEVDADWMNRVQSSKDKTGGHISAILWGPFKSGKTKFASTWPNPFFIAAEDGMLTVKEDEIPYVKLDPSKSVYETMMDIFIKANQKEGIFADIETIVIDSMSKLNSMMLTEILEESGKEKPEFDEWGKLRVRMNRLNRIFINLPFHRLVIVSEAYKEDKYEGELKPVFNIEGGFRDDMPGEYDNIWVFQRRQIGKLEKFTMHTTDIRGRQAGTRINSLPSEIENANYEQLSKYF